MGGYTKRLFKKASIRAQARYNEDAERLASCAIVRDGETHAGERSHYALRRSMGDENPTAGKGRDVCGYLTSYGRFVTRAEASEIGLISGQVRHPDANLLSCDIDW